MNKLLIYIFIVSTANSCDKSSKTHAVKKLKPRIKTELIDKQKHKEIETFYARLAPYEIPKLFKNVDKNIKKKEYIQKIISVCKLTPYKKVILSEIRVLSDGSWLIKGNEIFFKAQTLLMLMDRLDQNWDIVFIGNQQIHLTQSLEKRIDHKKK